MHQGIFKYFTGVTGHISYSHNNIHHCNNIVFVLCVDCVATCVLYFFTLSLFACICYSVSLCIAILSAWILCLLQLHAKPIGSPIPKPKKLFTNCKL